MTDRRFSPPEVRMGTPADPSLLGMLADLGRQIAEEAAINERVACTYTLERQLMHDDSRNDQVIIHCIAALRNRA